MENIDSKNNATLASVCWVTVVVLSGFLCLLHAGVMISITAGRIGFALVTPLTLLLALLGGYWLARRERLPGAVSWLLLALTVALVGMALALSSFYYDLSWDGQWYHQAGIIHIARDWNPLAEPMRPFTEHHELWLRHYAKGPWYIAAAMYKATGRIEAGKFLNWLALGTTFLAAFAACLDSKIRRGQSFVIAMVVAFNPVTMSEITTFMVDGVMASFLFVTIAATLSYLRRPDTLTKIAMVASSIICMNTKFTGLIYVCFVFAGTIIWCVFKQRSSLLRFAAISFGTFILGTCIWGYNPYITNMIHRQQPFYPMLGSAKYPSLTQQGQDGNELYETPKNMVGRGRPVRFSYSIFGRPGNQPYREGLNASLMWPFTARLSDLYSYTYQESRIAALGPFFSGCLVLSAVLWLGLLMNKRPLHWPLMLVMSTVIASLLLSPHLWWPRYAPQMWLLPIVPLFFIFGEKYTGWWLGTTWTIFTLLVLNAAIVAGIRMHWETRASLTLHHQLRDLHASGQEYEFGTRYFSDSAKVRLTAAGVRFRDVGMTKILKGHELTSVVEGYPDAIRYRAIDEK